MRWAWRFRTSGRKVDALAHTLQQRARVAAAQHAAAPDWSKIASFYAGRPVKVLFPGANAMHGYEGAYDPNAPDHVSLSPAMLRSLQTMNDPANSVMGLTTLLHEALRARGALGADGSVFQDKLRKQDYRTVTGGSVMLLPDMLQRFFGIKFDSPRGQLFYRAAKRLYPDSMGTPSKQYQNAVNDHDWPDASLAPTQSMGDITGYIVAHLRRKK